MKSHKKIILTSLLLLIAFHSISNFIWQSTNEFPQGRDTFEHLNKDCNTIRLFKGEIKPYFYKYDHSFIYNIIFLSYHYPSAYYLIAALFYNLCSIILGYKAIYLASHMFFILLIISVHKIARLYFDESAGLFAALLCSFTPIIYFSSRQFNLEIAVTAMVGLTYYFFLKSNNFTRRKYTVLAGITAGFSLLFKYTALVFIFTFILKSLWEIHKKFTNRDPQINIKENLANLLLLLLCMSFIGSVYYFNSSVIKTLIWHAAYQHYIWKTPERLLYYLTGFFLDAQGLIASVLFLTFLFLSRKDKEGRKIVFFLIGIPYLLISLVPKRPPITEIEFLMPSIPFAAIFMGIQLSKIKNFIAKRLIMTSLIFFLLFQFFFTSFTSIKPLHFFQPFYNFPLSLWGYAKSPIREYACKDALDYIASDTNKTIRIGTISHPESMNIFSAIFGSYIYLNKKPWDITFFSVDKQQFYNNLQEFDYLIYPAGIKENTILDDNRLALIKDKLRLVKTFNFESFNRGSTFQEYVHLYKRIR